MYEGPTQRTQSGVRFRKARSDSTLGTLQSVIERVFGLPEGSVRIVRPDGRKMRSDALVRSVRKRWDA